MVTAEEHPGIVLTILLLSLVPQGRRLLLPAAVRLQVPFYAKKGNEVPWPPSKPHLELYQRFIKTLEYALCFQAWYEHGTMWCAGDHEAQSMAHRRCRNLMKMIKEVIPRLDGDGWDIPKMHELMHVTRDTTRFGRLSGFSSSKGEQLLKPKAKHLGKTVQKRGEKVFTEQSIIREREQILIDKISRYTGRERFKSKDNRNKHKLLKMHSRRNPDRQLEFVHKKPYVTMELLCGEEVNEKMKGTSTGVTTNYKFHSRNQFAVRTIYHPTQQKGELTMPGLVHRFLARVFAGVHPSDKPFPGYSNDSVPPRSIHVYREAIVGGLTFRADPNYFSLGEHYDWAMVKYMVDNDEGAAERRAGSVFDKDLFPSKLLAFVSTSPIGGEVTDEEQNNVWAVIQTCTFSDHENDSLLSERWVVETERRKVRYVPDGVRPTSNRPQTFARRAAPVFVRPDQMRKREVVVPKLRLVPLQSLVERVLVLEEIPGFVDDYNGIQKPVVHLIHDRKQHWPSVWMKMLNRNDIL